MPTAIFKAKFLCLSKQFGM